MVLGRNSVATKATQKTKKTSELRYLLDPFWKFNEKLPSHSTPLCKSMTIPEVKMANMANSK